MDGPNLTSPGFSDFPYFDLVSLLANGFYCSINALWGSRDVWQSVTGAGGKNWPKIAWCTLWTALTSLRQVSLTSRISTWFLYWLMDLTAASMPCGGPGMCDKVWQGEGVKNWPKITWRTLWTAPNLTSPGFSDFPYFDLVFLLANGFDYSINALCIITKAL